MEDEFERILYVFDLCPSEERKIAFLLRQVEELVKVKNHYKDQIIKMQNSEEN